MKTSIKIILDIVMTLSLALLMKISFTGMMLHEVLGLAALVMMLVHLILNRKWIAGVTKAVLAKKATTKAVIMLLLNVLLLVCVLLIALSSVLISNEILPLSLGAGYALWANIHICSSYVLGALVLAHIALHYKMLARIIKNAFKKGGKSVARRAVACVSLVVFCFVVGRTVFALGESATAQTFTQTSEANVAPETKPENETVPVLPESYLPSSSAASSQSEEQEPVMSESIGEDVGDIPAIEDYLSNMFCTACRKNCPITDLRCSRGDAYLQQAVAEYNETYSTNVSY